MSRISKEDEEKVFGFLGAILGLIVLVVTGLAYLILWTIMQLLSFFGIVIENSQRNEKYKKIILEERITCLGEISRRVGKPFEEAKKDVIAMIEKGELLNAYIDESTQEIVIDSPLEEEGILESVARAATPGVFECQSCGAENTVEVGDLLVCEFCGTDWDFEEEETA